MKPIYTITPNPESIWGVEALDPLQQNAWACEYWKQLQDQSFARRPLLLLYTPSSERLALRVLQSFARYGRRSSLAVFFSEPSTGALLDSMLGYHGLFLVHHASHFLNLKEWLHIRKLNPHNRIVLTAPVSERDAVWENRYCTIVQVPKEEIDYCNRKAEDIFAKFGRPLSSHDPDTLLIEQFLIEAGRAGVEIPLGLLSAATGVNMGCIVQMTKNEPLCHYTHFCDRGAIKDCTIAFRGPWLADYLNGKSPQKDYPRLSALQQHIDPGERSHRLFYLTYLVALRAQGRIDKTCPIGEFDLERIHTCRAQADMRERLAWDLLFDHGLRKLFSLMRYFTEKQLSLFTHHDPLEFVF